MNIINKISTELKINESNIKTVLDLLNEGNTVPFIARYRKEMTGNMTDEQIYKIKDVNEYLTKFVDRRESIKATIIEKNAFTEEIEKNLENASTLQELEDIYLPFKSKRKTLADVAKERGLEPLADLIFEQETTEPLTELAEKYLNDDLEDIESVLEGVKNIITGRINEEPSTRKIIRSLTLGYGEIVTHGVVDDSKQYEQYIDFTQSVSSIPSHRVLAINRAEKEEVLNVSVNAPEESIIKRLHRDYLKSKSTNEIKEFMIDSIDNAYKKYIKPSIERDVRRTLTEQAEEKAIENFKKNLYDLLMQPPIADLNILAIDPAYRTGCKIAIIDKNGSFIDYATIYPHQPQNQLDEAKNVITKLIDKHEAKLIAIGNGTASRETEAMIADILSDYENISYLIVDEAGASVYSASELARKEFPKLDVSIRGAVSIARRVLDPLAELVKIDPKSIGVGMYQHDVNQTALGNALEQIVISCVNNVGVDLNTASASLLHYIAGISTSVANNIIKYREKNHGFSTREELTEVTRLGAKTFEQCAGFLRVRDSQEFLDNTRIHPESYSLAYNILEEFKINEKNLRNKDNWQNKLDIAHAKAVSEKLKAGLPTVIDIITELKRPGHDPRSEMPTPIFNTEITTFDMLYEGLVVKGVVRNVIDFGAFVDIGVKQDGLIHISEMSNKYINHPKEVLSIGDQVDVKIIKLDKNKGRISLSLKI
jgi:uncharacterized protein